MFLLQTVDYFYPLVDDPFQMGQITCANVLSDLYAMGVCKIDSLNVMLKLSSAMSEREQEVTSTLLIKGLAEGAAEAETCIGQVTAVVNPWCTIGGIASAILNSNEYILPINAKIGDVLVLTKPLGTQIACASFTPARRTRLKEITKDIELESLRNQATKSMMRLNKIGALLMHKYDSHACTDVTGFGILGHANNLAAYQLESVSFLVNRLPVMQHTVKIAQFLGMRKLIAGISPETSGGLLIALHPEKAAAFCSEILELEGCEAWIIGEVIEGERKALLADNPEIIEVAPTQELPTVKSL